MKKIILAAVIIVCSIVIIHAFFIPWAKASTSATKVARGLVKEAGGSLQGSPFAGKFINFFNKATENVANLGDVEIETAVSGYDIPAMINKKSSRIAVSLAQTLFKDAKDLDKKSLLVYLLPLFGIVCIGLALVGFKSKISIIVMAVISGAISIGGLYELMTVDLTSLPVRISIENGLWQTMYGYLLIFVLSIVWLVADRKK